jgi:hypothetical protein
MEIVDTVIGRTFKQRVYASLQAMAGEAKEIQNMLILKLQPSVEWSLVWGDLHGVILTDGIQ